MCKSIHVLVEIRHCWVMAHNFTNQFHSFYGNAFSLARFERKLYRKPITQNIRKEKCYSLRGAVKGLLHLHFFQHSTSQPKTQGQRIHLAKIHAIHHKNAAAFLKHDAIFKARILCYWVFSIYFPGYCHHSGMINKDNYLICCILFPGHVSLDPEFLLSVVQRALGPLCWSILLHQEEEVDWSRGLEERVMTAEIQYSYCHSHPQ